MAVIAIADLETREAAEWAAEDCGATYPKVISGTIFTPTVNIYFDVCDAHKCMDM